MPTQKHFHVSGCKDFKLDWANYNKKGVKKLLALDYY